MTQPENSLIGGSHVISHNQNQLCSLSIHQTLSTSLGDRKSVTWSRAQIAWGGRGSCGEANPMAVPSVLTAQSLHSSTMPGASRLLHARWLSGFLTQFWLSVRFRPQCLRAVFLFLSLYFGYIDFHRNELCRFPILQINQSITDQSLCSVCMEVKQQTKMKWGLWLPVLSSPPLPTLFFPFFSLYPSLPPLCQSLSSLVIVLRQHFLHKKSSIFFISSCHSEDSNSWDPSVWSLSFTFSWL